MTRYPVDKVLAKIAEAKKNNIYTGVFPEAEANLLHQARIGGLAEVEQLIKWHILTEQFDEEETQS